LLNLQTLPHPLRQLLQKLPPRPTTIPSPSRPRLLRRPRLRLLPPPLRLPRQMMIHSPSQPSRSNRRVASTNPRRRPHRRRRF
jgi:hypothetical protein